MTGRVTISGVTYNVHITDLTPADVLPVFHTDTGILKTDSILLYSAGAEQNSAKKVLLPHLISLMSGAVAEDVVLTVAPYYDANNVYQGMYWHLNSGWLHRTDTGEMIRVDDEAAAAALAADQANTAASAANTAATSARNTESRLSSNEDARVTAENLRKEKETERQTQETERESQEATRQTQESGRVSAERTRQTNEQTRQNNESDRQKNEADRNSQEAIRENQESARQSKEAERQRQEQLRQEQETARQTATATAISDAEAATEGAENVNAEMDGMVVTVTNRRGEKSSVSLAFDIHDAYPTIAAMTADLANIPNGGLASIATDDKTDPDNAKLYQKRSDGKLVYICDLDQAAAAAWADWLANHKQQIETATAYANEQGAYAEQQAGNANSIWNTVKAWFNGTDNDGFKATSESWLSDAQATWADWFSDTLPGGVRKLWSGFWTNIHSRWEDFFGEETGTPTKGVQKTWADWFSGRDADWTQYKSDKDTDWADYKDTKNTNWTQYKEAKDTNWSQYKEAKDTDWTSYKEAKDTDWVDYKDAKDADWTQYKDGKDSIWTSWFSDTLATGVRKLWNDFWAAVNVQWYGTEETAGLKKEVENARDAANEKADQADEQAKHAKKQGDYAKDMADHSPYVADGTQDYSGDAGYVYNWDYEQQKYVRGAKLSLDWPSMTQEQKDALARIITEQLDYEPVETAAAMWDDFEYA